jgi:hypothetical protein
VGGSCTGHFLGPGVELAATFPAALPHEHNGERRPPPPLFLDDR